MKKETAEEVLGHPLWLIPTMLLIFIATVNGLHTTAHLRMKIDANAYCKNNAEWVDSNTDTYDDY